MWDVIYYTLLVRSIYVSIYLNSDIWIRHALCLGRARSPDTFLALWIYRFYERLGRISPDLDRLSECGHLVSTPWALLGSPGTSFAIPCFQVLVQIHTKYMYTYMKFKVCWRCLSAHIHTYIRLFIKRLDILYARTQWVGGLSENGFADLLAEQVPTTAPFCA